ncbi:DUF6812 domain-containing protein [Coleofasciculus sp.]|uniref:DUF6812 domain-containing protein n=1 Tax=Coleofasciculus sp. TaxID=3100458 RepID=UPI004064382A
MRELRVKVLTVNKLQILGILTIDLSLNGYHSSFNISDLLNSSRNFITLTDVEVYSENQHLLATMPSLCINKPAIACLSSEESEQNGVELSLNTAVQPSEMNSVAVFS